MHKIQMGLFVLNFLVSVIRNHLFQESQSLQWLCMLWECTIIPSKHIWNLNHIWSINLTGEGTCKLRWWGILTTHSLHSRSASVSSSASTSDPPASTMATSSDSVEIVGVTPRVIWLICTRSSFGCTLRPVYLSLISACISNFTIFRPMPQRTLVLTHEWRSSNQ